MYLPEIFPRCDGFPGHAGILSRRVASPLLASEGWWWIGTYNALSPQGGDLPVSSRHQAWSSLPTRREPDWRANELRLRRGAASLLQNTWATPHPLHLLQRETKRGTLHLALISFCIFSVAISAATFSASYVIHHVLKTYPSTRSARTVDLYYTV